ncbi:MAG: bifunctional pyr operon transcriptional regulator/uracil phosphoribosyltransferase PyrR [Candidatus Coatesbacteria bacterium]|nr:MAG: bifunctional pyr operon transcriptional regulator/uracil phosphoribosyltransferase PyrR [Candidatus Coatesbacteria bacterium]
MVDKPRDVQELLSPADTAHAVTRIASEIVEENGGGAEVAIVGIHTGGVPLADRLVAALGQLGEPPAATGTVDITLYRDDLSQIGPAPVVRSTDVAFDVAGMTVVLVDDVVFTGRTVRAAIDNLIDLGRPRRIELAVLIDRGGRELPIQPDFVGKRVDLGSDRIIEVVFDESGDRVISYLNPAGPP